MLALPALASAQSENTHQWKGFFDFFVGGSTGADVKLQHEPKVAFGLNFTEGYQITDYLFAGVGFGVNTVALWTDRYYYDFNQYYNESRTCFPGIYAPIFADVRWTLDINRTINPFVDLKIGYQFAIPIQDEQVGDQRYVSPRSGIFCLPSIGVRFGKRSGFNLGVGYSVSTRRKYDTIERETGYGGIDTKIYSSGAFVVTFGADF